MDASLHSGLKRIQSYVIGCKEQPNIQYSVMVPLMVTRLVLGMVMFQLNYLQVTSACCEMNYLIISENILIDKL